MVAFIFSGLRCNDLVDIFFRFCFNACCRWFFRLGQQQLLQWFSSFDGNIYVQYTHYADFKCEKRQTTDDRQNIASNIAFLTPLNQIITIITLLFLRVSFVLTCMCSFYLFLVRTVSLLAIFFISLVRYFYQIQKICRTFFQNDCFQFYSIEVGMQL